MKDEYQENMKEAMEIHKALYRIITSNSWLRCQEFQGEVKGLLQNWRSQGKQADLCTFTQLN